MIVPSIGIQLALDVVGVFVFALSGGLVAVRREFDLFGVLVLAGAAGLGGGVLRDVLLGAVPPVGITDWRLVATALAGGMVTFLLAPGVERVGGLVRVLDAAGLGVFAVAGSLKALELGAPALAAVIVGVLTGVGGGALRDLLSGQVPQVLSHRELYATCALVGSGIVVVAERTGTLGPAVTLGAVLVVFTLRVLALRYGLRAPGPMPAR